MRRMGVWVTALAVCIWCAQVASALSPCQAVLSSLAPGADGSLIDADTPLDACVRELPGFQGSNLTLVFSDEFSQFSRAFGAAANDPRWTAVDLWYHPTADEEVYKPDAVTTRDGNLVITASRQDSSALAQNVDGSTISVTKSIKSGMLQGWNKACFRGGYFEARVRLPGNAVQAGFWPAFWLLGNLGRAGYAASTQGLWPWSYNNCSGSERVAWSPLDPQLLSACDDRPPPAERARLGLLPGQGRGAPEIDILEAKVAAAAPDGTTKPPHLVQSLQMGPVLPPGLNWADPSFYSERGLPPGFLLPGNATPFATRPTQWFGPLGPQGSPIPRAGSDFNDCLSAESSITDSFFSDFHTYGAYWEPGERLHFYIDGVPTLQLEKSALAAACNAAGQCVEERLIPVEPMYLILNLALSNAWSPIDPALPLPADMLVDWVRVWQLPAAVALGCSPPEAPTQRYIACQPSKFYLNPGDELLLGTCPP